MKKIFLSALLLAALAACSNNAKTVSTDKTDSAKRSSDSLVNASPDTLKAK